MPNRFYAYSSGHLVLSHFGTSVKKAMFPNVELPKYHPDNTKSLFKLEIIDALLNPFQWKTSLGTSNIFACQVGKLVLSLTQVPKERSNLQLQNITLMCKAQNVL